MVVRAGAHEIQERIGVLRHNTRSINERQLLTAMFLISTSPWRLPQRLRRTQGEWRWKILSGSDSESHDRCVREQRAESKDCWQTAKRHGFLLCGVRQSKTNWTMEVRGPRSLNVVSEVLSKYVEKAEQLPERQSGAVGRTSWAVSNVSPTCLCGVHGGASVTSAAFRENERDVARHRRNEVAFRMRCATNVVHERSKARYRTCGTGTLRAKDKFEKWSRGRDASSGVGQGIVEELCARKKKKRTTRPFPNSGMVTKKRSCTHGVPKEQATV